MSVETPSREDLRVSWPALCILNGLIHETEWWDSYHERQGHGDGWVGAGYHLSSGPDPLDRYHPDGGGYAVLSCLRELRDAGLVTYEKDGSRGSAWIVTADGDELIAEWADELPNALCHRCGEREAIDPKLPKPPEGVRLYAGTTAQRCGPCIVAAFREEVARDREYVEQQIAEAEAAERYVEQVAEVLAA